MPASTSRAFSSRYDLFSPSGCQSLMPALELPLGKATDTPRPIWTASICEPVDRISVYLVSTRTGIPLAIPANFMLELRIGIECIEEPVVRKVFLPKAYNDGGHLFTWASMQLFDSIAFTGVTIDAAPNTPESVTLRVMLDRAGMCCSGNPVFGPLAAPQ